MSEECGKPEAECECGHEEKEKVKKRNNFFVKTQWPSE